MGCHRVAQAMWSFVRYIKSAFLSPPPKSPDYNSWLENAAWSLEEKKNMSIVAIAWYSLKIVIESQADLINKRKFERTAGLCLTNPNTLCSPFYILKFEISDITCT